MSDVSEALSSAVVKMTSTQSPQVPTVSTDGQAPKSYDMLSHFFEVPSPTAKQQEYMGEIDAYLAEHTNGTEEDRVRVLRDLKYRLGAPVLTADSLENVYRYVHLRQQAKIFEDKAKGMEQ